MKPMTKEEWDARQSIIRKVVDPETGRTRWGVLAQLSPTRSAHSGGGPMAAVLKSQRPEKSSYSFMGLPRLFFIVQSKQLRGLQGP